MKTITNASKKYLLIAVAAASLVTAVVALGARARCPLPADYGFATGTTATNDAGQNSPPTPGQDMRLMHNGFELCVPPSAVDAHVRHGDTILGPCDKPGRVH